MHKIYILTVGLLILSIITGSYYACDVYSDKYEDYTLGYWTGYLDINLTYFDTVENYINNNNSNPLNSSYICASGYVNGMEWRLTHNNGSIYNYTFFENTEL